VTRQRVVIVGGGFAGLACALALDARRFAVTVVDRRRNFEFIPNVHELISAVKKPADLRLPLASLLRDHGHRFQLGEVRRVQAETRTVTLASGRTLQGDYLVLATGSADADFGVSGVRKHALPLKSVADGTAIARRLQTLEKAGGSARIVIVGAGLAGMEAVGEVLRRRGDRDWEVHLVEAQSRLLPGAPAAASRFLEAQCAAMGVHLHLLDPVARVTPKTLLLRSGLRLRSDATIWTGGPAPPPLIASSGLSDKRDWVRVSGDLSLPDHPQVFAAGDSAELPKALTRQAYFALDMGTAVAANISRRARGRRSKTFRALPRPTLLAFGDVTCILVAYRIAVAGKPLMALKEGIYAAVMAQLDRRRAKQRLPALLRRGRASSNTLWPLLDPRALLAGNARLKRLT
jgi:NADH dehydrogenase FAD-containing subunit